MVGVTPSSQDAYTHQILNSYLKEHKRYATDTIILKNEVRGQGHSDTKMVCDTLPSHDAFTYQIWNPYLIKYKRYAPNKISRSEVKFKVSQLQYTRPKKKHRILNKHLIWGVSQMICHSLSANSWNMSSWGCASYHCHPTKLI